MYLSKLKIYLFFEWIVKRLTIYIGRYFVIYKVIEQFEKENIPRYGLIRESTEENPKPFTNLQAIAILKIRNQNYIQTQQRTRLRKAGVEHTGVIFLGDQSRRTTRESKCNRERDKDQEKTNGPITLFYTPRTARSITKNK